LRVRINARVVFSHSSHLVAVKSKLTLQRKLNVASVNSNSRAILIKLIFSLTTELLHLKYRAINTSVVIPKLATYDFTNK